MDTKKGGVPPFLISSTGLPFPKALSHVATRTANIQHHGSRTPLALLTHCARCRHVGRNAKSGKDGGERVVVVRSSRTWRRRNGAPDIDILKPALACKCQFNGLANSTMVAHGRVRLELYRLDRLCATVLSRSVEFVTPPRVLPRGVVSKSVSMVTSIFSNADLRVSSTL